VAQPASSSAEIPASAAAETNEELFMALPFFKVRSTPRGAVVCFGGGTAMIAQMWRHRTNG
jgi:hypothetical protein